MRVAAVRSEGPSAQMQWPLLIAQRQRLCARRFWGPAVTPGMQVTAEINLGTRSVMEYLLSPVQRAFHEAGRER